MKSSMRSVAVAGVVAILLVFLTVERCFGDDSVDLLGPVGNSKDLFSPPPPSNQESAECRAAKAYLARKGKRVPKDCATAIKLASDLSAQEYIAEIKRRQSEEEQEQKDAAEAARQERTRKLFQAQKEAQDARAKAKKKEHDDTKKAAVSALEQVFGELPQVPNDRRSSRPDIAEPSRDPSELPRPIPLPQSQKESESEQALKKILNTPTTPELIEKLDLLDQFDGIAHKVSEAIYNKEFPLSVGIPESAAVTLAENPASGLIMKYLGEEGGKLVGKVGQKIDEIFGKAEKSYGRKAGEPAKNMFDN
jgi:hypothetical protein